MVVLEVIRREAMILRIVLSSMISSSALAWGTRAWTMGSGAGAEMTGGVRGFDLMEATRAAAAEASLDGGGAGLAVAADVASMSLAVMRPAGPVPMTVERFRPRSAAILRAKGEAMTRSPGRRDGCGADIWIGAGVAAGCHGAGGGGAGMVGAGICDAGAESPLSTARTAPMGALSPS